MGGCEPVPTLQDSLIIAKSDQYQEDWKLRLCQKKRLNFQNSGASSGDVASKLRVPALLVQRRLRWFGHAARRPKGPCPSHTASHMALTSWKPAEDVGNHYQGRPGTTLWTASLRPHAMEKGLSESL